MRFVLVSTHIDQTTGYSKVSYNLLKQLATLTPKIKMYHFGFQRHPSHTSMRKYPVGISSYDAAANEDPREEGFGFNKINEYLDMVSPDVVMIYNDPLTICRFMEAMKYEPGKTPYRLWIYLDQVYSGIAPQLIDAIRKNAERIYCFSETWKQTFLEYGPAADVRILGHGVDPTVFTRMSAEAKATLRTNVNIPAGAVILLNANRNSQRKRLDLTIAGFVRALARNPTLYLIVATNVNPQTGAYYDIHRIFMEELKVNQLDPQSVGRNLVLMDTAPPNLMDDEAINQLYNLADLGINTSDGEGYGLCQLEHMLTGAPQIVTDVGTYRTFLNTSVAEIVPSNGRSYFTGAMPHGLWSATFSAEAVADAIESAVTTLAAKREAVRTYAFDGWSKVCDEFLEDVLTLSEHRGATVSVPVMS